MVSPAGGQPPLDPNSDMPDAQTEFTERFKQDPAAKEQLATTHKLADINAADYDAVFYPGGHGPMWDLAVDKKSISLIENFVNTDKPVAFVCHAPAALKNVKVGGEYFVKDKKVTGFSNTEEQAVGLADVVPFLLEDVLQKNGDKYERGVDWQSYVVEDSLLITGQNPASSEDVAKRLIQKLQA